MERHERFLFLLNKYTAGALDIGSHDELFALISSGEFDELFYSHFSSQQATNNLPGADMSPDRAQEILLKILVSEQQTSQIIPVTYPKKRWKTWAFAAAMIGVIFATGIWFLQTKKQENAAAYVQHFTTNMVEKINETNHPLRIQLEDSSFLTLLPGAKINYPNHFTENKREVFMDGEVFFEIKKQHGRPFFVYNDKLITQVLGTRFRVRMDKEKNQVEVSVVSGKVQVSENKLPSNEPENKKDKSIILLPNQKVIYKEKERQFNATLVSDPLPVTIESMQASLPSHKFIFDDTPLSSVLTSLQKSYGIEIITQNDGLNNCLFTGDVDKYDLYTKLEIICQSIKATYEITGTKILIKGQGCD